MALVMLLPGNFLAAWLIERMFWNGGLSLSSMGALSTLLLLPTNAVFWWVLMKPFDEIRARLG
ncbi:hypothetical protein, partial [Staphylococcus aureus]